MQFRQISLFLCQIWSLFNVIEPLSSDDENLKDLQKSIYVHF